MGLWDYKMGITIKRPGEGKFMTYREFFGENFFKDLKSLKYKGAERIVFGFSK